MKKSNIKQLRDEADAIYQQYQAGFAGKARATRDLDALDELIGRLDALITTGRSLQNGGRDPALQSLLEQAIDNLETYEAEREAIAQVQEQGPVAGQVADLATWANLHFGQYFRHFAGKPRATRDLGLLAELTEGLEAVEAQMSDLVDDSPIDTVSQDLETVRSNLEMYRKEAGEIHKARRRGDLEEQASYLAVVANEQFAVYKHHFAGKPRVSRRPGLLERLIGNLEATGEQMKGLRRQGLRSDQNDGNERIVRDQLSTYRDELERIAEAKAGTALDDQVGHLGSAANAAMGEYREHFAGKDRQTRDLELLSRLCDELFEVARQMRQLGQEIDSQTNADNLQIVIDNLVLYQNEYEQIFELQQS